MTKKLSLLLAAIAVIALAVPAFAQAGPELTIGGKKAVAGETLTATSTNATTQTALGLIKCTSVAVHGFLSTNSGTVVEILDDTIVSEGTKGSGCTVGGKAVAVEHLTLTEFKTTETGKGTIKLDFTTKIGEIDCTFSTAGSTGTYVGGASPAQITLTNVDLLANTPVCEPGTLNGTFTVTSTGGAVILH